jgi:acyl-CoA synthetase (AMP-forming)/AMP-acid ligase II
MELRGYCADRLEDFMVPKFVRFQDLPKSANGKIAKRDLVFEPESLVEVAQ